jgi:hypothetical protein
VRGVKQRLGAPYFASAFYTTYMDADLAAGVLKEKKGATVGLVGRTSIPISFYEHLTQQLPDGYRFVDATDDLDRIKVPKSPEEQELIRRTAAIQDAAWNISKNIRPGMRDFEVLAEVQYPWSGRQRTPVDPGLLRPFVDPNKYQFRHFQNRVIKEGDRVAVLVETNAPAASTPKSAACSASASRTRTGGRPRPGPESPADHLKMLWSGPTPAIFWRPTTPS